MSRIATSIYQLLMIDGTQPDAIFRARKLMAELRVVGTKCSRCKGTGQHSCHHHYGDATCFQCGGRGAFGTRLSQLALNQLQGMFDTGELYQHQGRWTFQALQRKSRFTLEQALHNSGVKSYGSIASSAAAGDWDYDVAALHQRMQQVCRRFRDFELELTQTLTPNCDYHLVIENYQATLADAQAELAALIKELQVYKINNQQPDYRQRCLSMFALDKVDNSCEA